MLQGARAALGLSDLWGLLVRSPFRTQAAKHEKTPPVTHGHQCLMESSSLPCLYLRLLGHCLTASLLYMTPAPRALERETKELWAGVWRTELQFPVHSDFKCALQLIHLSKGGLGGRKCLTHTLIIHPCIAWAASPVTCRAEFQ